jgi:hypothetical protein
MPVPTATSANENAAATNTHAAPHETPERPFSVANRTRTPVFGSAMICSPALVLPLPQFRRAIANGYLGDIGVAPDPAPMDFNAWFDAFLGDRWFTFDPRHDRPRIGRFRAGAMPRTFR